MKHMKVMKAGPAVTRASGSVFQFFSFSVFQWFSGSGSGPPLGKVESRNFERNYGQTSSVIKNPTQLVQHCPVRDP